MQRFFEGDGQHIQIKAMKKRLLGLLTIIFTMSLITGCSKNTEKSSIQKLIGTWQWISTDGGFAFHIHLTPVSTGKNVELKITADGKYAVYTNDLLTSEGTYTLETKKCIHDLTDKTFINFSSDNDLMVEGLDLERLEVSDEAYDGLGSIYKRKNPIGN